MIQVSAKTPKARRPPSPQASSTTVPSMAGLTTAREGMLPIGNISHYVTESKANIVPGALMMNDKVKRWTLRKI